MAINEVLAHVKWMPRWGLEWEWMAESKTGEFIKRDELVEWLLRKLKA
jgi:predicted transcriptional regulator